MRRVIKILVGLAILTPAVFLIGMRYGFVASEGYPTWEAVRNYLVRDGEIVVRLPEGLNVVAARCDDPRGNVRVDGQTITTKIGHTWCRIAIQTEGDGRRETIVFSPQKLNNWNRMLFVPINSSDPHSDFLKFENGVMKAHSDVTREASSEQATDGHLLQPTIAR